MKASSVPTVGPVSNFDSQLTTYAYFNNFNLFLFSRTADETPLFLVHNTSESSTSTHFSGFMTEHDPILSFGMAREFITKTRGLLHSQNIQQFLAESPKALNIRELILEDLSEAVRPQKGFTPALDDICTLVADTPFLFQNTSGSATYFVEIPMLNAETFNEAAKQCGIDFQVRYVTSKAIMDSENNEISDSVRRCFDDSKLRDYTERFIINSEPIEITGHYAMISCDPTATTSMLRSLHYSVFRKHGESWKYYRAYEGEFPSDEELKTLKGILIPGSPHSAYETDVAWYNGLFSFQRKVISEHKHIKLLCICFGAQSLAQALGGKVEKMNGPYVRGGDTLVFQPEFFELNSVKESGVDRNGKFVIAESHGDHIVQLPPGAVLQASSKTTNVEIYTIGQNVLALQGHPEYDEIWTAGANFRIMKPYVEDYDVYAKEYIRAKFANAVTRKPILSFCFRTLKN